MAKTKLTFNHLAHVMAEGTGRKELDKGDNPMAQAMGEAVLKKMQSNNTTELA